MSSLWTDEDQKKLDHIRKMNDEDWARDRKIAHIFGIICYTIIFLLLAFCWGYFR